MYASLCDTNIILSRAGGADSGTSRISALHSECLARTCLAVGKNCSMITLVYKTK
jgi:hypothetical protein